MLARQVATQLPASTGAPELLELLTPPLLLVEEDVVPTPLLVVPLDEVVVLVVPLLDEDVVRPELLAPELEMPEVVTPELLMPPLLVDVAVVPPLDDPIPEEPVAVVAPVLRPDDASPLKSSPGSAAHAATAPAPTLARNTHTRTVEAVMPVNSWWFPRPSDGSPFPGSFRCRCVRPPTSTSRRSRRGAEGQRPQRKNFGRTALCFCLCALCVLCPSAASPEGPPPSCSLTAQKSPGT
jgi:hypothetical protein